jgi:hypothetical protein
MVLPWSVGWLGYCWGHYVANHVVA